uniref:Ground-like domain-containing protein n=1 Tax=Caenorhabditis japonica TaxID=281687 RepID=A0A8R1HXT8_CAEJA
MTHTLFFFKQVLISVYAQYPFGRPCGGGCGAPMCPPRMPCGAPPPMPMPVCPPPTPCPPQFCPPPPLCPPPPPPPMPCPPPPPMPRPSCPCMGMMQRPMFYTQYQPQYYQPMLPQPMHVPSAGGCGGGGGAVLPPVRIPAQNDCCCGCSSPCKYKSVRRAAFAAKTVDPACNSIELKNVILDNISNDASESKRNIQKMAEEALGHEVNVICGTGEFSYIAHTDSFCQAFKDDVTCYAFKPL